MGRVDDVINVSGHRLSTMEVESALVAHPKVAEAAVVGRPDEMKGEPSLRLSPWSKATRPACNSRRSCGCGWPRRLARWPSLHRHAAQDAQQQAYEPPAPRTCYQRRRQGRHHHTGNFSVIPKLRETEEA